MNSLEKFENTVTIALICVGWLHVPVLVLAGWATGQDIVFALCTGVALAALPTLLLSLKRPRFAIALAIAIAFVGHASLFAYLLKGHPWQIEAHFYYFALLAMLSGFCDWRVIVAAAGLIAVHHIGLNFLFPAALFPGGSDFGRVAFHAGIVVLEAVMLSGITVMMRNAFAAAYGATGEAERAAIELRDLAANREIELAITMKRRDELNALIGRFEQELAESLEALHQTAQMLENNASGLGATAESASSQSMKVAAITEETSIQVKTVAQAGDALAQTIAEVGASVSASSQLAGEAVSEAKATTSAIDEMAKVADEIGNVTNLISAIAGQTNLLALNATIEAARAGDAGRGFAVVAQEVKALAAQTAAATQDIATRIEAMQQATGKSVSAIGQISAVITELDRFSARISSTVEEQVASARDIAGSVSSVAEGVGEVAASVGQIEQVAERASLAASELNSSAAAVTLQTQRIRERVQFFASELARLRAMRASTPSAGSRAVTA